MSSSSDCNNNLTVASNSCSYRIASSADLISTTMSLEDGNEEVEIQMGDKIPEVEDEVEIITDIAMDEIEGVAGVE